MHRGYVKLYRKMLDGGILEDAPSLQIWVWLLLNATHRPRKLVYRGESYSLEAGQVFVSERHLADALHLSRSSLRRRISVMKSAHRIDAQVVHRGTIITICNWAAYQNYETTDGPQDSAPRKPQTDRRRTKNKNDKNEKNTETLPFGERFAVAWTAWKKYRQEIRKPLKPSTVTAQIKKLTEYGSEAEAVAVINQSIEHGWTGLFTIKADGRKKQPDPPTYLRGT